MRAPRNFAILAAVILLSASGAVALASAPTPRPSAIPADTPASHDPIARLQARLDAGEITLTHDSTFGYLPSLLRVLNIPLSSQSLVFSRTSLQSDLIAPWAPRALYFNDDVYVGFVQESDFLEIATVSATSGVAFYTLLQNAAGKPMLTPETNNSCLMCHNSRASAGVPGFIMLSTIADRLGYPITNVHDGPTTDQTPIHDRFGGWYVTGTDGVTGHSGNVHSPLDFTRVEKDRYRGQIDMTVESARTNLDGKFSASLYPSAHSDLVALMVLVHQTSVHNLLSTVAKAAQQAILKDAVIDRYRTDSLRNVPLAMSHPNLHDAVEKLVRAMLFIDAAPLASPMHGTTSFVDDFSGRGPRDGRGRSLRDFDLQHRLFKYPCSFLIYSEGFDGLPKVARDGVYARLKSILNGDDTTGDYSRLSAADRQATLEILRATKPEFAASTR